MRNLIKLSICLLALFGCSDESLKEVIEPIIKNNSVGKDRIVVVSHNTLDSDYLAFTRKNHQAYTKRQGYDYWFRNGTIDNGKFLDERASEKLFRLGLYWQKVSAVLDALNRVKDDGSYEYDWVVWVDADAFFTNMKERIEDIIAEAKPTDFFIIAKDYPGNDCVNAGVFLVKNNAQGRKFITELADNFELYKSNLWPEQNALTDMIFNYVDQQKNEKRENKPFVKRICDETRIIDGVHLAKEQSMNGFYTTSYIGDRSWQPGDFIAHMAGAEKKRALAKRLLSCLDAQGDSAVGCEPLGTWQEQAYRNH